MTQPHDLVTASRLGFGHDDEPPELPPEARESSLNLRLAMFLGVVSWFALIGVIATLRWLADGAIWLLRGAGL